MIGWLSYPDMIGDDMMRDDMMREEMIGRSSERSMIGALYHLFSLLIERAISSEDSREMAGVLENRGYLGIPGVLEDLSVRTLMDIMPGMGSGKRHALQKFFFAETPLYSEKKAPPLLSFFSQGSSAYTVTPLCLI